MTPTVRLDPLDRRLLDALDTDPTAPVTELAGRLGTSPRTVARRLARLQEHHVVRVIGRTLPGFGGALVRLLRARGAPSRIGPAASALARDPRTRWVRVSRDGTEMTSGVVGRGGDDGSDLVRLLAEDPRLAVRVHELLHVWAGQERAVIAPGRDLDELDRRLLELLGEDGRADAADLARRLGIDRSTVARRRRRLVDDGVVYFETDIHPSALTSHADLFLWLDVAPGRVGAVGRALRADRHVRFAAATSGEHTLAANLVLPQGRSVVEHLDGLLDGLGVTRLEIVPMGRVLKRSA